MPVLPFEIIKTVIDTLVQDDPSLSSTRACTLVRHDLLHICRRHIFEAIALKAYHAEPNIHAKPSPPTVNWIAEATPPMLQKLLNTTPEIADHAHVCCLKYYIADAVDKLADIFLAQTLQKITRLKTFSIRVRYDICGLQWADIPFRPVLLHLMHLPTLTHLKLFKVNNFADMYLASCANLEHFEFGRLAFDTSGPQRRYLGLEFT